MNQLLSDINNQELSFNQNLIQALQSGGNPYDILIKELNKSKDSDIIVKMLRENNYDGQKAFYAYAKYKGENGNQFIQQLANMGFKL